VFFIILLITLFQGDSIYAVVKGNLVPNYIDVLQEMVVYEFSMFRISDRSEIMRPVQNPLVIIFTHLTTVRPILNPDELFPEWTYVLTPLANLPAPHDTPAYLIGAILYSAFRLSILSIQSQTLAYSIFTDVIGIIRGISSIAIHDMPERNVAVPRRCITVADNR
jgi:hypothetical protein